MKYPKYERYKDSGSKYINELPDYWITSAIKYLVSTPITDGPHETPDFLEDGIPFISAEAIENGRINFNKKRDCISEEQHKIYSKKYKPQRNDVYVVKSGSTTGKVAIVDTDEEFNIWSPLAAIRVNPEENDPYFLFYALSSDLFQKQVSLFWSFGTQPNIGMSVLQKLKIPTPPLKEQQSIANFLDKEATRLDALITKKQQLIETLKEKRIAVISQAVTKGIKPDFPLKDSGIEWLGMIPKDWEVKKLKYVVKGFESGVSVNSINTPALDEEIGVLKTSCVYDYTFRPSENKVVLQDDLDRVSCQVKADSIIMSRMNTPDLVGASGYVEKDYENLFLPDRLWQTVFWPHVKVHVKWLSYIFISKGFRSLISSMATGTSPSMKNITQGNVLNIKVGVPDYKEQEAISNYLDSEFNKIEKIIGLTEKHIDKLIEYKTALISAAVTGKIKVPELA